VGFFFRENKVECKIYLAIAEAFAFPQTEDIESEKETAIVFQQDAAPARPASFLRPCML
jgi:hypothetical protein